MNYKCPKCGDTEVYAKPNGRRMGVYCLKCNSWISWTTYSQMCEIYKQLENKDLNDDISIRKIRKRNGYTTMECSKCGCLLYNSCSSRPQGQFDLVNAIACPKCGRKLI